MFRLYYEYMSSDESCMVNSKITYVGRTQQFCHMRKTQTCVDLKQPLNFENNSKFAGHMLCDIEYIPDKI